MYNEKILKQLCIRALNEFEDVKAQAKEYKEKFCKEEEKRLLLAGQFKQLKQVSLLAVAEYETLHKQYLDENKYTEEIGKKLEEVELENAEIRKLCRLGSNASIVTEFHNGPPGTKGELEVLRAMKDGMNEELRITKKELTMVKSELETERNQHSFTTRRLTTAGDQMRQLDRVSTLALGEFTSLRKKFEIESDFRQKAEEAATELAEEKKVTDEKLRILEEKNQQDEKIKALLLQIDELHKTAENERKESAAKINEQREELKNLTDASNLVALEEKLSVVLDQLDIAQKQLNEAEVQVNKSESEVRNLYTRLALAEKELQDKSMAPPPPPPPPPLPPPPLAAPVLRKFISKLSGKKKTLPGKDSDPQAKAMDDVVNKIKQGVKLRSVAASIQSDGGVNEDEDSAMGELAGLLSTLRRGVKPSFHMDSTDEENASPFGARCTLKRPNLKDQGNSMDDVADGPSNELKQKLLKQKSIADGLCDTVGKENNDPLNEIVEECSEADNIDASNNNSNDSGNTESNKEILKESES